MKEKCFYYFNEKGLKLLMYPILTTGDLKTGLSAPTDMDDFIDSHTEAELTALINKGILLEKSIGK